MANTYKALSTVTVGSGGAASISFTNIPQTYTDLIVKLSGRTSNNESLHYGPVTITVNNNTNAIYDNVRINSYGTTVQTYKDTSQTSWAQALNGSSATANTFSSNEYYLPNYASSANKPVSTDYGIETNDSTNNLLSLAAQLANTTTAITSVQITATAGQTIVEYSTATLYGVFNADVSSAPATPTIGTATAGTNNDASITFTPVSNAASYTMTSTPDSIAATGTTSPITISGLTTDTSYTFKVKSNNPFGSSAESAASNSITAVTPASFEFIASTTLGSSASTITFTGLPQTYTRLQVRSVLVPTTNGTSGLLYFNNDSTTGNYGAGEAYAVYNGSAFGNVGLAYNNSFPFIGTSQGLYTNYGGASVIDIERYTDTSAYTTYNAFSGFTYTASESYKSEIGRYYGIWKNTAAVTRLDFLISSGSFAAGSVISIYGIKG